MIINPFIYKIELWRDGIKIDDVSRMLSVSVTKQQNTIGILTFSVYVEDDFFEKYRDNTVIVMYRKSLVYGVPAYKEFEGHIVDIDSIEDDNIAPIATVICQDYKGLLSRRRILYYQSSQFAAKYGNAETIIKEYVNENIGEIADSKYRFANGKLDGFRVDADSKLGLYMEGEDKSGQNLFDVVKSLCDSANLKFDIINPQFGELLFIVRSARIGKNLSSQGIQENGINDAGNYPVVFSFGIGNISKVSRKILNTNRLTTVTAYGQGVDEDRDVYTFSKPIASGLDIREEVVNANNDDTDGLNFVAVRKFGTSVVESFSFEIIQVPGFIYGYNYNVGDLITFEYKGVKINLVVDSVNLSINEDGSEVVSLGLLEEL